MAAIDDILSLIGHNGGSPLEDLDPEALVASLSDDDIEALLAPILADEERARFNRFFDLFPDEGPFRRELYARHMEFFAAGAKYRERCFMAGNRTGKTVAGGFETSAHMTGIYPAWWPGHVFHRPIRAWAAGDTNETTRDVIQTELFGEVIAGPDGRKGFDGSGLVPRHCIGAIKWKQGVQDFADKVAVLHKTGGWSIIGFKSFDQGRRSFQGTAREWIWLDEECPPDVYNECVIRTATTRGRVALTFTPLSGLTETVLQFLPKEFRPTAD